MVDESRSPAGETEIDAVPKAPLVVELDVAADQALLCGFSLVAVGEGCGKLQCAERRSGIDGPLITSEP